MIEPTNKRIIGIIDYLDLNFQAEITLKEIAGFSCMSIPAFCNFFRRETGETFTAVLNRMRISKACKLLKDTDWAINEIGYRCGFSTMVNFHKQFKKIQGVSPLRYRKMVYKPLSIVCYPSVIPQPAIPSPVLSTSPHVLSNEARGEICNHQ